MFHLLPQYTSGRSTWHCSLHGYPTPIALCRPCRGEQSITMTSVTRVAGRMIRPQWSSVRSQSPAATFSPLSN